MNKKSKKLLLSLFLLTAGPQGVQTSNAEILRVQTPCDSRTCVYWLPKLPALPGWHLHTTIEPQDAVVLVPDGYTYTNAEYIIYARALQKGLLMDRPSLQGFIAQDAEDYKALYPGIKVTEAGVVQTAQHDSLRSLKLTPSKSGPWEQITYHEEGDHFVVVVLTSKTAAGYKKARTEYIELLRRY